MAEDDAEGLSEGLKDKGTALGEPVDVDGVPDGLNAALGRVVSARDGASVAPST